MNETCCSMHKEKIIDPVCGMTVDLAGDPPTSNFKNQKFYFCSSHCKTRFDHSPEKFLQAKVEQPVAPTSSQALYTCPMHPEVPKKGPGTCAICGMALEPMELDLQAENPELIDFRRRLIVSSLFAIPLAVLSMTQHFFPAHSSLHWMEFALSVVPVVYGGKPILERGWQSFFSRHWNMFTLIAVGVVLSFVYSVWCLFFAPGSSVYFEAAAVILCFVLLGQVLELAARGKTMSALRDLMSMTPPTALREKDGSTKEIPLNEVLKGDHLRVKPSMRIPVDGIVLEGNGAADESFLSGEPIPVAKAKGDPVYAGTYNTNGSFLFEAKAVGKETLLARIIQQVVEAQRTQAPVQRLADSVSAYFIPFVVITALVTGIVWFFWGPEPHVFLALTNAVSVLIIACPCALGLATPMSIVVASGRAARQGLLLRRAEAIEALAQTQVLVLDKTGTLTEGKPTVIQVWGQEVQWAALKALETRSEHPLAQAMVKFFETKGIVSATEITEFQSRAGDGVLATWQGKIVRAGTMEWLKREGIDGVSGTVQEAGSLVGFSVGNALVSTFLLKDQIRPGAKAAVEFFQSHGVRVILASGDRQESVNEVAQQLGITEVIASARPERKLQLVKDLQAKGLRVAMVGDGVNDAPAITQAEVGIAVGSATDVTIANAGIVVVKGDITALVRAWKLSEQTMRNIKQNLFFAFVYNFLGVPVAAGLLYPFFGLLLSPMIASAAMSFSSVSVVVNALRLSRQKI